MPWHSAVEGCRTGSVPGALCRRGGIGCPLQHDDAGTAVRGFVGRDQARDERDRWVRLFNRIEAAVSHHKRATATFTTDADDALYAARDRILRDAALPSQADASRDTIYR